MYLYIGGAGGDTSAESKHNEGGKAGYNGGAKGADDLASDNCPSAGGGGATDLRLVEGDWNNTLGLISRIMVAGGGGSGGCFKNGGNGGDAGGIIGEDGFPIDNKPEVLGGKGGTQNSNNFGIGLKGEDGSQQEHGEAGGSGGGGYYGGEGGKTSGNNEGGRGGGGESSFISGMDNCLGVDEDGKPVDHSHHYSNYIFKKPIMIGGVNLGNGYALITKITQNNSICFCSKTQYKLLFVIIMLGSIERTY